MATLILNADASPVSFLPLSVIPWEEAIKYLVSDKATVLEWHENWIVRSEKWSTRVPSVMILKEYQKKKAIVRFSKQNIFLRDEFECQYCGVDVTRKSATLDHVLPVSKGGKTDWKNCTTACSDCNSKKGNDARIIPLQTPYKPNYYALVEKRKKLEWDLTYPEWYNYFG
jgi:5-methylcytosine-specific restriction endonuclease McrA